VPLAPHDNLSASHSCPRLLVWHNKIENAGDFSPITFYCIVQDVDPGGIFVHENLIVLSISQDDLLYRIQDVDPRGIFVHENLIVLSISG